MPTLEVSKMNPAQMMILESFADVKDEREVSDLMTVTVIELLEVVYIHHQYKGMSLALPECIILFL